MTKKYCTYKKYSSSYEIFFENGVKIGALIMCEDGYYNFFPELRGGYWTSYIMREIADKVDEINKPWDEKIQQELG